MVERITAGGGNGLDQGSVAVGDKELLVCPVVSSCKFSPCFSAEIQEQGSVAPVLGKTDVASLFRVVPDGVR